ncbi:MAG TPA: glyoxalase/bleomycin resistance/dioxygenase family protein [Actinobacteria bacterium]|nr:glyoxalase/bleomycin resistance/dioxygenase family protein [Actinomycetota bacterium]
MSRVQLALNVSDLEASVEFYSRLFNTTPHKRRPGYANFAVSEPPLKLVLIQASADERGSGVVGALNHLGIEVENSEAVAATAQRLVAEGVELTDINRTVCCYAEQDKTWAHDPAGAPWEIYTITDDLTDASSVEPMIIDQIGGSACCTPGSAEIPA